MLVSGLAVGDAVPAWLPNPPSPRYMSASALNMSRAPNSSSKFLLIKGTSVPSYLVPPPLNRDRHVTAMSKTPKQKLIQKQSDEAGISCRSM